MNTIDKLWQEYLRDEYAGALPPVELRAALRRAFFMGNWCQLVFGKKLQGLEAQSASKVTSAMEKELAREVAAPRLAAEAEMVRELAA